MASGNEGGRQSAAPSLRLANQPSSTLAANTVGAAGISKHAKKRG